MTDRHAPLGLRYTSASTFVRQPMSEARRNHIHGRLEPLERADAWNWTDTALVLAIILTATVCVWGAMQ